MKKQLAGILALAMSLTMAACSSDTGNGGAGNSGAGGGEAAVNETTTTAEVKDETTAKADEEPAEETEAETEETTAETTAEAEDDYYEKALAMLPDAELKRKYQEVKVNVYGTEVPELAVRLFEEKYGGTATVISVSHMTDFELWEKISRVSRGADLFVSSRMQDYFPSLVEDGSVLPFDDHIDLDSDIWSFTKDNKDYMELFNFGGKHFNIVTDVFADGYLCFYNKQTIEKYGFDDPWELYKAGNWNWDTMKSMLSEFADEEDLRYGLEGRWFYPTALYRSAGTPIIGLSDGYLVNNAKNQTFLSTLDLGLELFNSGLVHAKHSDDYNDHPELLGAGDALFYIGFTEAKNVEDWSIKVSPEDIGIVPVPSPAGSAPYQSASVSGICFLSKAENQQGAELFAQCLALAYSDPGYIAEQEQKRKEAYEGYGLSDQIISQLNEIDELARQYPVIDYGMASDALNKLMSKFDGNPVSLTFTGESVGSGRIDDVYSTAMEKDNKEIKKYIDSLE